MGVFKQSIGIDRSYGNCEIISFTETKKRLGKRDAFYFLKGSKKRNTPPLSSDKIGGNIFNLLKQKKRFKMKSYSSILNLFPQLGRINNNLKFRKKSDQKRHTEIHYKPMEYRNNHILFT